LEIESRYKDLKEEMFIRKKPRLKELGRREMKDLSFSREEYSVDIIVMLF